METESRRDYNEGQPPMARTGMRRGLLMGLAAFVLVVGLIVLNTRHEIMETASKGGQPATSQSQPMAPNSRRSQGLASATR